MFEPNNTALASVPITAGTYSGLTICDPPDDDFYELTVVAGATIDASILFSDAEGDIDLRLYSAAGTPLRSSTSLNDNEQLSFTVIAAGIYRLKVDLYSDAGSIPGNNYTLILSY